MAGNGNVKDGGSYDRGRLWLYDNKFAKTDRHPVFTGPGEVSKIALLRIVDIAKSTDDDVVRLRCAAWSRTSKNGNEYTYVTVEPEEKKEEEEN